ncbi:hypothetical protein [Desulfonatronum parangueonense]
MITTIRTSAFRTYLKKKPGPVMVINNWGLIIAGTVAVHLSLLEPDLAMIFNLTDEDLRKQVINAVLKVETHSITFHDEIPKAIATMDHPANVVPCTKTPLLFQIGESKKSPTNLHVFKSESAPDESRRVLLIDQTDMDLLGFPSNVTAPRNGTMPLIADSTPAPKRIAAVYSQEAVDEMALHLGSLLSLIPKQAGMGLAA